MEELLVIHIYIQGSSMKLSIILTDVNEDCDQFHRRSLYIYTWDCMYELIYTYRLISFSIMIIIIMIIIRIVIIIINIIIIIMLFLYLSSIGASAAAIQVVSLMWLRYIGLSRIVFELLLVWVYELSCDENAMIGW